MTVRVTRRTSLAAACAAAALTVGLAAAPAQASPAHYGRVFGNGAFDVLMCRVTSTTVTWGVRNNGPFYLYTVGMWTMPNAGDVISDISVGTTKWIGSWGPMPDGTVKVGWTYRDYFGNLAGGKGSFTLKKANLPYCG